MSETVTEQGFTTDDIPLSALFCFLYTSDSLLSIKIDGRKVFLEFDVTFSEAEDLQQQYIAGTLTVENPRALFRAYSDLTMRLKLLHRNNETEWRRDR